MDSKSGFQITGKTEYKSPDRKNDTSPTKQASRNLGKQRTSVQNAKQKTSVQNARKTEDKPRTLGRDKSQKPGKQNTSPKKRTRFSLLSRPNSFTLHNRRTATLENRGCSRQTSSYKNIPWKTGVSQGEEPAILEK